MATPKRLVESRFSKPGPPYIFEKSLTWPGVKVNHNRLLPGEISNRQPEKHHIIVPLAGWFEASIVTAGGYIAHGRRSVSHTSIVPAGQQYSAFWREELEDLAVHFEPDFITQSARDILETDRVDLVTDCDASDPLIHQISLALASEVDAGAPNGSIYAETLVNTLVAHLLRHYSSDGARFRHRFGGLPKHKLRRVTEFIDENLERDLTLAEIAEAADLSTFHFARSFKQTTGATPIQFLMQRRIEFAKRLLAESQLPIVEIGLMAGFKNQSHFTTLFRKITAMTPKTYRNIHLA
jgi:AraC family transcriptional regulator